MPCVDAKKWLEDGKKALIGRQLLHVDTGVNNNTIIKLKFTNLIEMTFWSPERSTLNLKEKLHYTITQDSSKNDRDYWGLRLEEILMPLQVCSLYVAKNDIIIISFGKDHVANLKTLFDYQLSIKQPTGAQIKL